MQSLSERRTRTPRADVPDGMAQYWNAHDWATIGPAGSGVNEVQQLTVHGYSTTGTFTLSFNGRETRPISGHPTAGEIEDALTRLIGIGTKDVAVADLGNRCTRSGFQCGHPSFAASFEKLRTLVVRLLGGRSCGRGSQ
ncbi:hypothetical protein [Mycobacterium sp.]|uniref:hypothetical protein n=1 Tax=Mycobacterium sp. TaxID=1785 RepID=UPI003F9E9DB9